MTHARAIVIGSSMAGLMAARALADHFEEVIVLERDRMPDGPKPRKGVPQGRHLHVLLEAGRDVAEHFFPGIVPHMQREGMSVIDLTNDVAWHHFGVWKTRCEGSARGLLFTRPFFEHHVRERLKALCNVSLRYGTTVAALRRSADAGTITGVVLDDGSELEADLVVDASGRGSRVPGWLEELGYARPVDEEVGVDLTYTSGLFEPPRGFAGEWKLLIEYPSSRNDWRSGFISCVEGNRWVVSLNGYFKEGPGLTQESFLAYAKSLPRPELHDYVAQAKPLSELVTHRVPTNRWRHYEKLSRFPEGLVVLGDSVCALNPVFGQGMSAASMQAQVLAEALVEQARVRPGDVIGLEKRVRMRLPRVLRLPWFLTSTLDLNFPPARGKRPFGHGVLMAYVSRLLELTSTSPHVFRSLAQVLSLKSGLWEILKPSVSLRVLAYACKGLFLPLAKRANVDRMPERTVG